MGIIVKVAVFVAFITLCVLVAPDLTLYLIAGGIAVVIALVFIVFPVWFLTVVAVGVVKEWLNGE